jgi:hypothetical protein
MSELAERLRNHYPCLGPKCENRELINEAADRIAELEKDLEQSVEHIDNLQFCSEERGFFYCPNCGEGTTHLKDCYIGVFLAKHKP